MSRRIAAARKPPQVVVKRNMTSRQTAAIEKVKAKRRIATKTVPTIKPLPSIPEPTLLVVPPPSKGKVSIILEALPFTRESVEAVFANWRENGTETRFKAVITPDMAAELLKANVHNRSINETLVLHYARALTNGEWLENGDALRFANTGALLDGQHRLRACVEANLPIVVDVVLGLDPRSQMTMDGGRRRTVGDNLALMGQKYAVGKAAMMRSLFLLVEDRKNYRTTTPEVAKLLARYPQIDASASLVFGGRFKGAHSPIIASIHFLACEFMGERAKADAFIRVFQTGQEAYKNDPAHRLRERLISTALSGKKFSTSKLCDCLVQVYNYHSDRKAPANLRDPSENLKLRNLDTNLVDLS